MSNIHSKKYLTYNSTTGSIQTQYVLKTNLLYVHKNEHIKDYGESDSKSHGHYIEICSFEMQKQSQLNSTLDYYTNSDNFI